MDKDIYNKISKNPKVDIKDMQYFLWYSLSQECYIHRDKSIDDSFFSKKESDIYFVMLLISELNLDKIKIFDSQKDCNEEIINDNLKFDKNVVYITKHKKNKVELSLFYNFVERIRNAIAHGTFSNNKNEFCCINQKFPSEDSEINSYLYFKNNLNNIYKFVNKIIKNSRQNYDKVKILAKFVDAKIDNKGCIVDKKKKRKFIFENIDFNTNGQKNKIIEFLKKKDGICYKSKDDFTNVYIIPKISKNIGDKTKISKSGKNIICGEFELLKYLGYEDINL